MTAAIHIEDVSKLYRLGVVGTGTISHDLNRWWARLRGQEDPYQKVGTTNDRTQASRGKAARGQSGPEYVWALKDINLEVEQGEILGIIGCNGAGKSTLLKLLSRVTAPTTGEIKVRGRIASLLEVGTGFHPELTGRENIYLNGSILGMKRREITAKLDEIADFSGCSKYLDTPVKRYSSGMMVRLGFAVAAHLEPEILIIDEVLAVGDAEFQKRCLGKIQDVAHDGRTVLFVSHNMQSISTLTSKCLLLWQGTLDGEGHPADVIRDYLARGSTSGPVFETEPHESEPRVVRASVSTSLDAGIHVHGQPLSLEFQLSCPEPVRSARFSFQIIDELGRPVLHLWTYDSERPMCRTSGNFSVSCNIPKCRLYMGRYQLIIHFGEGPGGRKFQTIEGVCPFEVVMHDTSREGQWLPGTCTYIEDVSWQVPQHRWDFRCLVE